MEQTETIETINPPKYPEEIFQNPRDLKLWTVNVKYIIRGKEASVDKIRDSGIIKSLWALAFLTSEEAEANAIEPIPTWIWDGTPARETTLGLLMDFARKTKAKGVRIVKYENNSWITYKEYPANVSLI